MCAALRGRAEEGSEGEGEGGGLGLGWPQHQASRCAVLLREPTARGAAKPRARRSTGCARRCVGEGDQVLGLGPGVYQAARRRRDVTTFGVPRRVGMPRENLIYICARYTCSCHDGEGIESSYVRFSSERARERHRTEISHVTESVTSYLIARVLIN